MEIERRHFGEVRMAGRTFHGIAAPYDRPADIGPGLFTETIARGAMAATLAKRADVLALVDHRGDSMIGRTKSGTLRLTDSPEGLAYSVDLPRTPLADELIELQQRGDLGGVSIAFTADRETWANTRSRRLDAVTVHEISIIRGHAAYGDGTTIALRARLADPAGIARLERLRVFLASVGPA
jgi:HK97 family phage prohead protease